MARISRANDDDDDDDFEDGILKDGHSVRFRMTDAMSVMDAWQDEAREQAEHFGVTDGTGDALGLHRPGYRYAGGGNAGDQSVRDGLAELRRLAYDLADKELSARWRDGPTGFGSTEFRGSHEGDLCTCRGSEYLNDFGAPGRLVAGADGSLVCMPDHPSGKRDTRTIDEIARDHRLRMAEEYDARDRELASEYKRGGARE